MKKVLKMTIIVAVALGIVALLIIPGKEHLLDDGTGSPSCVWKQSGIISDKTAIKP